MSNWMFWKHAVSECNYMKEISGMKILQLLYWVQKYFAEHPSEFFVISDFNEPAFWSAIKLSRSNEQVCYSWVEHSPICNQGEEPRSMMRTQTENLM